MAIARIEFGMEWNRGLSSHGGAEDNQSLGRLTNLKLDFDWRLAKFSLVFSWLNVKNMNNIVQSVTQEETRDR